MAGSTAGAAQRARVPARGVDGHLSGAGGGDHGGGDRDFQLRTAYNRGVLRLPVDIPHRSRNELTAIHRENKALLHLSEGNGAGRKRSNDRCGAGASAQGIQRVTALKDQESDRKRE